MKITQVTPGLISIPPKGWGAIEKIIWNYKIQFEKMGHECGIQYLDDVDTTSDIIHIHVANLAIMAQERGIPYIFSLHDHHVVRHGKDSQTYKENLDAIKGSIISFTHAENLCKYFDETDKLFYLSHGVDTELYKNDSLIKPYTKLLCVANNGYADNQSVDRKGFRYAIEAARELNHPITIVGPKNNENFFNVNKDLLDYDKLHIIDTNPNEEELIKLYNEHTIFLHPSELEAGHPNLTLLEAISCGLPIVGTYDGTKELNSIYKIDRSTNSVVTGIKHVTSNIETFVNHTQSEKLKYDWSVICKRLLNIYNSVNDIKKEYNSELTKQLYIDVYENTNKIEHEILNDYSFNINFINGAYVEILGSATRHFDVEIWNDNHLDYKNKLSSGMFAKTNKQYFHNWKIKVYDGDMPVFDYKLNLSGKRVYIAVDSGSLGDNIAWMPYIDEFRKRHNCHVITSTFKNDLFKNVYPKIEFVTPGSTVNDLFAMYTLGWFYDLNKEPTLPNIVGLQEHASLILGLDHKEIRTKIDFTPSERPYEEKYVVIATSSTAQCKFWNNETGWIELVDYLKSKGYRVINISKEGNNVHNAEMVSDTSMYNTQNVIHHSEFMIGLSSGLSWLSWALGKHVVMLSNFTSSDHEFVGNCTRIVNYDVCNGCWNKAMFKFDKGDWNWCPEHKNTPRQHECHKLITSEMVINQIQHLIK